MWQLVFALCHCLIPKKKKNKNKMPKGCLMVMADPLDLGHGKKYLEVEETKKKVIEIGYALQ